MKVRRLNEDIQYCWFGYYVDRKGDKKYIYATKDSTSRDSEEGSKMLEDRIPEPYTKFVFCGTETASNLEKEGWTLVECKSIDEAAKKREPKFWNTNFSANVIKDYEAGKLTFDNIEEWDIAYNDGKKPNPPFNTKEILDYYIATKSDKYIKEGYREDSVDNTYEIGDRVAQRWTDEFNVGTVMDIKKDEEGVQYLVEWDYSDGPDAEWLYGDLISYWIEEDNSISESKESEESESINEVVEPQPNGYHNIWPITDTIIVHNDGGVYHVVEKKDNNNKYIFNTENLEELNSYLSTNYGETIVDPEPKEKPVEEPKKRYPLHMWKTIEDAVAGMTNIPDEHKEAFISLVGDRATTKRIPRVGWKSSLLPAKLRAKYGERANYNHLILSPGYYNVTLEQALTDIYDTMKAKWFKESLTEEYNKGDWVEVNLNTKKNGTPNIIPVKVDKELYHGKSFLGWAWGERQHEYPMSAIVKKIDMDDIDAIIKKYTPSGYMNETFDVDKVQKRIARHNEFDNGHVIHSYEKMTSAEAEEKARLASIENPDDIYYVSYDNIMNPCSDIKWKNSQKINEASYGGAFDIADNQYFTRADIESAAEEVINHIDETFYEKYILGGTWFENNRWIVNVQSEDRMYEFEDKLFIDMRKIRRPEDLKNKYALDMAAKLIAKIKQETTNEFLQEDYTANFRPEGESGTQVCKAHSIKELVSKLISRGYQLNKKAIDKLTNWDNEAEEGKKLLVHSGRKSLEVVKGERAMTGYTSESLTEDLEGPKEGPEYGLSSLLNDAIQDEFKTIDLYNTLAVTARAEGFENIAKVIEEINIEENRHVGQLQEALKLLSPNASAIDDGEVEGQEQLANPIAVNDDISDDDLAYIVTKI